MYTYILGITQDCRDDNGNDDNDSFETRETHPQGDKRNVATDINNHHQASKTDSNNPNGTNGNSINTRRNNTKVGHLTYTVVVGLFAIGVQLKDRLLTFENLIRSGFQR